MTSEIYERRRDAAIGTTFDFKGGSVITIEGFIRPEMKGGKYKCTVSCSVCSQDKELFPNGLITSLDYLKKGKTPCGCGIKPKWSESQWRVLCERDCIALGLNFKEFTGPFMGQKTGIEVICTTCQRDEISAAGLCSGIFKTTAGKIRKGSTPCRCSPVSNYSLEQWEFRITKCLNIAGGRWIGWEEGHSGAISSQRFNWVCSNGHLCTTVASRPISYSIGCIYCHYQDTPFGLYPSRKGDPDNLYLLSMVSENEEFLKIGRSFNVPNRVNHFPKDYTIKVLSTRGGTHEETFRLEQDLHSLLSWGKYIPEKSFNGCQECFNSGILLNSEVRSVFGLTDAH